MILLQFNTCIFWDRNNWEYRMFYPSIKQIRIGSNCNNALKVECKKFRLRKTSFVHAIFDILFWLCSVHFSHHDSIFGLCKYLCAFDSFLSLPLFASVSVRPKFHPVKDHVMCDIIVINQQVKFSGSFTLCTGCEWQTVNVTVQAPKVKRSKWF